MKDVMEMFLLTQEATEIVIEGAKEKLSVVIEDVEKKKFLRILETTIEDAVAASAVHADVTVAITFSNIIQSIIYKNVVG